MNEPNEPKHEYLDDTLANQQPSKSARKREANATLDIARQLVDMSDKLFNTLHLDPDIRNAAALAKNIRTHGGKKRQIQYLAKLMRQSNVADIQRQLDAIAARAHTSKREHHRLEQWRDRLIVHGDDGVGDILQHKPQADRQKLRQLTRNARKDPRPKATRALFQYLKSL